MGIEQAMELHQDRLMAVPGVTGVGIGQHGGRPSIVVMVARLTAELAARFPQELEGHPVVVEESGEIVAF